MPDIYLKKIKHISQFSDWLKELPLSIPKDRPVVLKPNLVYPISWKSGVVSDVRQAGMLIEHLRRLGVSDITIAEGPGLGVDPVEAFEKTGFGELSRKQNVSLLDLNQAPRYQVKWYDGELSLPLIFKDAYYINLPKLKTHINTLVTLGLKNQKGLLSYSDKKRFHKNGLHRPVAELYKLIRPDFTILDGFTAIEGDGPLFAGKKVGLKVLMAGADSLAVDAAGCRLMGIDPLEVEHLKLAYEMGLGSIEPGIVGDQLKDCARKFKRPEMEMLKMLGLHNQRTPLACSMCGGAAREGLISSAKNPGKWARSLMPVLWQMAFGRINFVYGQEAALPKNRKKVIAVGDCTRHLKNDPSVIWVEGCPPSPEMLVEAFAKLRK
ncbi:MAG: DUF362 domain-containing protein [Candidatus Edwardsbacteria bacterium]|nr:DUF362 domain-containing protein [Candidatus Edwardsbacteria bacterium]MBU1576710.1 DUF362 domain-containing protein [Candidatus Edwardsbacteria bacterium]MBU2463474.1 DUF362 domain-containing protein [Candidatus Edwardsbacteria bacterium]MBU2593998.1 DUF362 domain-containing protein [Candidatus Edwardsbacteria bacterium]